MAKAFFEAEMRKLARRAKTHPETLTHAEIRQLAAFWIMQNMKEDDEQ